MRAPFVALALIGSIASSLLVPSNGALSADAPGQMGLISRGVPAYTNDRCGGTYPPALANDSSYDTQWKACDTPSSSTPIHLTYDLAGVPAASRGQVLVAWYNDPTTSAYDHTYVGQVAYDIPSSYVLQGNAAPGASLPSSGWVTLASVSGNVYHSRQHVIDLTGFNWFRLSVTASDGSSGNFGVFLNLDIHDASSGLEDDWIFYGDSITQAGMAHNSLSAFGGSGTWAQLINTANPGYFPASENGGIGGALSADGAGRIGSWLSIFPGRYVGLSYGSNDAGWSVTPTTFYNNYVAMIQAVQSAGRIAVVPKIPWSCNAGVQANAPALNERIDALYAAYPSIVRGPDLWSYFQSNQSLMSGDCLHPTNAGYAGLRQQWANAMLSSVYAAAPAPPPPAPPPAANLVGNAGFESGSASWSLAATAIIDAVASNAHSGTRSLRLAATGPWQGSWQSFPVTAGQSYGVSGWERSSTSGGYLSVFSFSSSWTQLDQGTHLVYPAGGSWTQRSGTYVPPPGTAYALIGVQSSGAGTFYFDDMSLSASAPPALQISAVQAGSIGATSAVITWQTNNSANSRVDYGTTTAYGGVATSSSLVSAHSVALSGLSSNTTYHYKVSSVDGTAQSAVSADATFTTTAPSTNLVTDPGFESGGTAWSLATTASIDTVAANAHSGTRSLRLAATGPWQGSWQSFAVTPGQTYTLSAWERSSTSGGFLSVFSFNSSWTQLDQGTHLVYPAGGGWTRLSGTYVPPPGTAYALIGVQSSGVGTFFFDDLDLSR